MVRMRTITEAHNELIQKDPNTSVSKRALDRLIREGKVPCIRIGRKRLINMDMLENYLRQCGTAPQQV